MKDKVYVTAGELKALDESIEKWVEKVATRDGEEVKFGSNECPCCIHSGRGNCDDCAIHKDTSDGCDGTPYYYAVKYGNKMDNTLRSLCMNELNYLRDLRDRCVVGEESKKGSKFEVGSVWYIPSDNGS